MVEVLTGMELARAREWLEAAAVAARASCCLRKKCGAVLVGADGEVFGLAENRLPEGAVVHCNPYAWGEGFKSDRSCCVHAEQRVLMCALAEGREVRGSTLVYASLGEDGVRRVSGKPYCTICSKMALECGVGHWVLEHADGVTRYGAAEYNRVSFGYGLEAAA